MRHEKTQIILMEKPQDCKPAKDRMVVVQNQDGSWRFLLWWDKGRGLYERAGHRQTESRLTAEGIVENAQHFSPATIIMNSDAWEMFEPLFAAPRVPTSDLITEIGGKPRAGTSC